MDNFNSFKFSPGLDGFNYNRNITSLSPSCMVDGSYNFNILSNTLRSRGGTKKIITLPERSKITSLQQVFDNSQNEVILSTTSSGRIYSNSLILKNTGIGISKCFYSWWNGNVIFNFATQAPKVWNRTDITTTDFPEDHMAADWITNDSYPQIMMTYGKGNSVRAWGIGQSNHSTTLYFSAINDGISTTPDFSTGNGGFFVISTPEEEPLTALISFGDRLIIFSKSKAFILNDNSLDVGEWGYTEAQWKGGVISQDLVLQTENDILCMTDDGTIYSITAVVSYGDYKISSTTEVAAINKYIQKNINITQKDIFHAKFDPTLRAIKYFVPSYTSTFNNTALCYFIDKNPQNGWSIHNNTKFLSGYNAASSATALDVDTNSSKIITGDYNGNIWELERGNLLDETNPYPIILKTPYINFNDPRNTKRFKRAFIEVYSDNPINIDINYTANIKNFKIKKELLDAGSSLFDIAEWDVDYFDQENRQIVNYNLDVIGVGLEQTFNFYRAEEENGCAIFDISNWDEGTFCQHTENSNAFEIISNIVDYSPISNRRL